MVEFNKKVLGNGLTVLFEKRDVPVTTVMLATKFGSIYEKSEEKGIAHFIEHLVFKGTKKRTALDISSELECVGGVLNAFTDEEETAFHVKLPSNHLALAIEVIFDIFFNPLFSEEEIKKEANVICEEIKMYKDNPPSYVINKIKECLYHPPFGEFIAGSEKTVLNIKREDIIKKHKEFYVPQNSILCVVGNNSFDEIIALAEAFSPMINSKLNVSKRVVLKNENIKEERVNLEQANVVLGFHMPFNSLLDRASAEVFSSILGDGMSSKLFTEIRERRGLAYSVKSLIEKGKEYSYLLIYIGTEKSHIDEVISLCLSEFKKMGFISQNELDLGKQKCLGSYDVESEASDNVALKLILHEIQGKVDNYYNLKNSIKEVSLEEIKKISQIVNYSSFVLA